MAGPQEWRGKTFFKKVLALEGTVAYSNSCDAGLAQLVARNLAKVEVAGSNPVARSMIYPAGFTIGLFNTAKWPSGKAEACKAFIPGSNPGFASSVCGARRHMVSGLFAMRDREGRAHASS